MSSILNEPETWPERPPLYRGFPYADSNEITIVESPIKRIPLSMPISLQREIDDWFAIHFGVRFRESSLFATGCRDTASRHAVGESEVRVLRPLGPYMLCWSPTIEDLFVHVNDHPNIAINDLLSDGSFRTDGLAEAICSGNEVMLVGIFEAKRAGAVT
jgi:hypothetical protein